MHNVALHSPFVLHPNSPYIMGVGTFLIAYYTQPLYNHILRRLFWIYLTVMPLDLCFLSFILNVENWLIVFRVLRLNVAFCL